MVQAEVVEEDILQVNESSEASDILGQHLRPVRTML